MRPLETLIPEAPPLIREADGALCVGRSRVTLETVIGAFNSGFAAEELLLKFPSLDLADIYVVIAYYMRHREEVDAYVLDRRKQSDEIRQEIEKLCPPHNFRERLLSRRAGTS